MWQRVIWVALLVALGLPVAGYLAGKAQTARWEKYAPWVGVTYWDMRRLQDSLQADAGINAWEAAKVVEMLACSSVPRHDNYAQLARAAALMVRQGQSADDAVRITLMLDGMSRAVAVAALEGC